MSIQCDQSIISSVKRLRGGIRNCWRCVCGGVFILANSSILGGFIADSCGRSKVVL